MSLSRLRINPLESLQKEEWMTERVCVEIELSRPFDTNINQDAYLVNYGGVSVTQIWRWRNERENVCFTSYQVGRTLNDPNELLPAILEIELN